MNYQAMNAMDSVVPSVKIEKSSADGKVTLKCNVSDESEVPAVGLRLLVLDAKSGERMLPIDYEDNYFSLLKGQSREVSVNFEVASCSSGRYDLYIEGWNVKRFRVRL